MGDLEGPRTAEPADDLQVAGDVALDAAERILEDRGYTPRTIIVSIRLEPGTLTLEDGRDATLAARLAETVDDETAELVEVLERQARAITRTA